MNIFIIIMYESKNICTWHMFKCETTTCNTFGHLTHVIFPWLGTNEKSGMN